MKIVINMDAHRVRDHVLSLAASKLSGIAKATVLMNAVDAVAPALNDQGGFNNYRPIDELAPHTGSVTQFVP